MKRSRSNVRRLIADVLMCCLLIVTGIPMTAKADDAAGLQQSAPVSAETTENGEDAAQTPAVTETAKGTAQAPASEDTQKTESTDEADAAEETSMEVTSSAQNNSQEKGQSYMGETAPADPASAQTAVTDNSREVTEVSDQSQKQDYTEMYEFYDSEKTCVSSQTVRIGDILAEPAVPKTRSGKTFTGWKDASGADFHSFGTVKDIAQDGAVIRLYASYADAIYINYYDQYNNLIKSQPVEADSTVTIEKDDPLIQVQPLTQCQDGWSTDRGSTQDVSGDFKVGTESVNLYPILKEGYWVEFKTDSETSIPRQFIARNAKGDDAKVSKPGTDPVRKGYVFDQWYEDQALTEPYDFSQTVTKPLTLYAGYKPAENTEYTVKYWIEYQKKTGSGVGDGVWDYKLLTQEVIKGKTGDKAGFHTKLIFSSPYEKSDAQYELNTDLTTADRQDPARPTIQADGSTVLNVYYRCKTYNLSAIVPKADGTTQKLSYENVKCSSDLTNFWKAVFAIRPEQELFDGKHRFVFRNIHSGYEFVETPSVMKNMPSEDVAMYLQSFGGDNSYYEEYLETLNGKAPDGKTVVRNTSRRGSADTRTYYLQLSDHFNSGTFGGTDVTTSDFPGFTPLMEYSDGNYYLYGEANASVWFRYPEALFQKNNPGLTYNIVKNPDGTQHMYNGANDPIRIYYERNHYPLNFHTNGGPEAENQSVLFEDDLRKYQPSNYSEGQTIKQSVAKRVMQLPGADPAMNRTKKKEGNENFVFAGWYTDSALTNSFDFSGTMPAHEVDLYARWVPETYTVRFDTGKGSAIDKISDIPYGHAVARPQDPTYKDHIFLGWTLNGKPYNFASGVTEDIVLKAEWRSIKAYKVTYDLNGGSGPAPGDTRSYYENAGVTVASADGITAPKEKVFLGWKSSGDGKIYYPNGSAPMPMGGLILTAQWGDKEKTAQLTYDFNFEKYGIKSDGNSSSTVSALKNNSSVQLADICALHAVPDGYVFKGWYLDKDCTDGPYTFLIVNSRKASCVYAKWEVVRHETAETGQSSSGSSANVTGNTVSPASSAVMSEAEVQSAPQLQPAQSGSITKPAAPSQVPMQRTGNSKAPATGDTSHIELYFLVMTGCLAILVTDFMIRKRHDVRRR